MSIPDFEIEIGGKRWGSQNKDLIRSIKIKDEVGTKSDTVTIEIANKDHLIKKPTKGVTLEVSLGYEGEKLSLMGRYTVDGVGIREGLMIVRGIGFDALGSIKSSGEGVYNDVTLGDVVKNIGDKNGLKVCVSPEYEKTKRQIIQQNESDLSFLNRLAKENNATLKTQGKEILFVPKNSGTNAAGRKLPFVELLKKDIAPDWSYDDGKREKFGEISAKYFDLKAGADGEVKEGSGEPKKQLQRKYGSKEEALAAIRSHKAKSQASAESLTLTIVGRPQYRSEARVLVKGLDPDVDGPWVIESADHDIGSGYKVSLTLKKILKEAGDE
jgi:uncharacterized protein